MRTGLAFDPMVPHRELCLDRDFVAAHVPTVLGAPHVRIDSAELVRVKYRVGQSLRAVWRIGHDSTTTTVTMRSFCSTAAAAAVADRASRTSIPCGDFAGTALDNRLDAVWWTMPNDRRISGLPIVLEPPRATAEYLGLPTWKSSVLTEYAPEKCATVRALDPSGRTLGWVKITPPGARPLVALASHYRRVREALHDEECGATAPLLTRTSENTGMAVVSHIDGSPWKSLDRARQIEATRTLGVALAVVHNLPITASAPAFTRLNEAHLTACAEVVAAARPDLGHLATDAAYTIASAQAGRLDDAVLVHGDVHPGNVLVSTRWVGLIDFDQYGIARASNDLGSFIARIRSGELTGDWSRAQADTLVAEFLQGYATRRHLPADPDLRWFTAAALLIERATRAVNRYQPSALATLDELLSLSTHAVSNNLW